MTTQNENDAARWPFSDPRVAGVKEHYERVKFFQAQAEECPDPAGKFRLLLAGVTSARAVVELIFEAADKGQLKRTRESLKAHLCAQIAWYELIERIRIHDFHRFGLVPPDPLIEIRDAERAGKASRPERSGHLFNAGKRSGEADDGPLSHPGPALSSV